MKLLRIVLGMLVMSACSGEQVGDDPGEATSALEVLRSAHGDPARGAASLRRSVGRGASRIADLQADAIGDNAHNGLSDPDPDDGGWDFTLPATATAHSANPSPPNLFGATGLGVWVAIDLGAARTRALVTTLDTGLGIQRNAQIDSAPDFVFGVLLAELADNAGFADLARQRYDAKRAASGGAAGLGARIRDARHRGGDDGLIAYDLGWLTLGAAALDAAFPGAGYRADADTYAQLVLDDLHAATPRFDPENGHEGFYITGLAWSLVAASHQGDRDTLRALREILLRNQRGDGAWGTNADQPAPDLQATAHALQTLALTGIGRDSRQAVRRATRWLLGQQAASGGWPDASHIELPLVDADIVLGLTLSRPHAGDDLLVPDADDVRRASQIEATPPARATPLAL